jgi:polyferredoxin
MLKNIRVIVSVLLFSIITFYFLDFANVLPKSVSVLLKLQFIPALLGLSFVTLAVLLALTLLFGRVYCSSICPLGVFQDIISWFARKTAKKKKRFKFNKAKTVLRWSVLALALIAHQAGVTFLWGLLDPYSAFGRVATHVFKPVYVAGNNLLATIFTHFGNYTFYVIDNSVLSVSTLLIALLTVAIVGFMAWKWGRTFCNTICPVGTVLGLLSKISLFKVRIDAAKCNHCGACAAKCKSSCIDGAGQIIDNSRCVACFDCLGSCKKDALHFRLPAKKAVEATTNEPDASKRQFLASALVTAVAIPTALAEDKTKFISNKSAYTRQTPISPPGSLSAEHLLKHCTSCHLCISKCPTKVLKPAFMEYGIGGVMQPMMFFEKGFCNFDCTICADICPNNALVHLTEEQKHTTQMGRVVFNQDICVVHTEGTNCGACAEHCPTQAVTMVPYKDGLTAPQANPDICVGCGGCEFICPVRPYRAIFVEGNKVHQTAEKIEEGEMQVLEFDDFGF